jgi:hypothetical protein
MEIMLFLFLVGALVSGIALAFRERRHAFRRAVEDADIEPIRPASLGGPLPPQSRAPVSRTFDFAPETIASRIRDACCRKISEAKEAVADLAKVGIDDLPDPWSLEREAPVPDAGLDAWTAFEGRVDTLIRSVDVHRPPRRRNVVSGGAPARALYPTPRPAAGVPASSRRGSEPSSRPVSPQDSASDDVGPSGFASVFSAVSDVGGGSDAGEISGPCPSSDD